MHPSSRSSPVLRARAIARSAWRRWFLDRSAEFWLGELRPTWSLSELRARVVDVVDRTADVRSFVLAVPRRWPGHRAGQYVPVELEIDGVRVRRCYSICSGGSPPGAGRIELAVKRVPGGRVSPWLHEHLAPGAIVRLGAPAGDFTVAAAPAAPAKLLLVGGGSGITPVMAIVRDLVERERERGGGDRLPDVVVIEAARTAADAIFGAELVALATASARLRVIEHRGPLDAAALRAAVPDLAERETYVCGPPGLVAVVEHVAGPGVHVERFAAAVPPATPALAARPAVVRLARADREVTVAGGGPLLAELERAGERPAHGCRIGICNTCRCRKASGTVLDLVTGATSSEPDQDIRLCVSVARSDLELAL